MIQFCIILCSAGAIYFVTKGGRWTRLGFIVGLIGQPFWLYSSLTAEPMQWGVAILSVWFAARYIIGIKRLG